MIEKMTLEEFKNDFIEEVIASFSPFIENMEHLGYKEMTYAEWILTFIAWNEWSSEQDCKSFYGELEE